MAKHSTPEQIVAVGLTIFANAYPAIQMEPEAEKALLEHAMAHEKYFEDQISAGTKTVETFAQDVLAFLENATAEAKFSQVSDQRPEPEDYDFNLGLLSLQISARDVQTALLNCKSYPWC